MSMHSMRTRLAPWTLLAPFLVTFAVFTAYPLVKAALLSMQQTFGAGNARWVGLANFQNLWSDQEFWVAMRNTFMFACGSVFVQLPLSLGLAMLLETKGLRGGGLAGRSLYRVILFSPALVGVTYSAVLFGIILERPAGLMNRVLHWLTLGWWSVEFSWLDDHVMWALIVSALWMYVGFNMVFFSAALQNVRQDLVEAATVDGAGPWDRFWHVTVPAIRPVAGFVVLLSIIGSFQLFELPYLMLQTPGGPDNRGLTVVTHLYLQGFAVGDLGYASAIGWVLAMVLMVFAVLQRMLSRGEEEATT